MPEFPSTHFWKKTNNNPTLIEERKTKLENYFGIVVNDPFTRGHTSMKKFIRLCKLEEKLQRPKSYDKRTTGDTVTKSKSLSIIG